MKDKDIAILLQKADELRALFTLGQRVIPFLEEIFVFVRDIQPLLDEINKSVAENLKKMPGASEQLSKVNEANELATTEIMDIVDGLIFKVDIISENVNKISSNNDKHLGNAIKLLEILYKAIEQNSNLKAILPQLGSSINTLKNSGQGNVEVINSNADLLESIKNDSNSIMISLQVQDITSQQLAAVNHMLVTVQHKLSDILKHFQSSDLTTLMSSDKTNVHDDRVNVTRMHRDIAFDPIAVESLNKESARQENVDELIKLHLDNQIDIHKEVIDNDDIDSMFSSNNILEEVTTKQDNFKVNEVASTIDDNESLDNDDIDSFFANNQIEEKTFEVELPKVEEKVVVDDFDSKLASLDIDGDDTDAFSQDDIDALFGKIN